MTLIEVLAALAILGSVLAIVMVARGRWIRQYGQANRKLEAVAAADELMRGWSANGDQIPRTATGSIVIAGQSSAVLLWRTSDRPADSIGAANDLEIVRLQLFETTLSPAEPPASLTTVLAKSLAQPVVTLELLAAKRSSPEARQ